MSGTLSLSRENNRIVLVDALRGFAVAAIMLLHFIEHFIYDVYPTGTSPLLASIDQSVKDAMFFLFAGKSYSIFALLFGFTFAIQYRNQATKGKDFCGRFVWRMLLLFLFGTLNAAFFPGGDVLVLFAIMGLVLVPLRKLGQTGLLIVALVFLVQPLEIFYTIRMWIDPTWAPPVMLNNAYYPALKTVVDSGNFWEMAWANITTGQLASFFWAMDAGRMLQAPGLFLLGAILGRGNYFTTTDANRLFWTRTLVISALASFILYVAKSMAGIPAPLTTIFTMWYNIAFTGILVAAFVLLFRVDWFQKITTGLQSYGKMSLTNYVSQSIIGSLIFFPYALNLAPHAGFAGSFIIGLIVMFLQIKFCQWWLASHRLGVLEGLWHKATWIRA
ncbi:MAG: DUF418 domain-containing protein [Puniceicoccales bacterium]|jgi:uncharacterized protein|nr:DUF418 domain-containing protein [Puniceicoccales bacterium]